MLSYSRRLTQMVARAAPLKLRSGRRSRRFKSCHPDHLSIVLSGSTAVTRLLDGELRDASRKDFSRSLE